MIEDEKIKLFLTEHPDLRLFGEWLVPHSLKTYREECWRKFYVFDVVRYDGERLVYLPYEEYSGLLAEFDIEFIPPIFVVNKPTEERLYNALEQNNYLIQDGQGTGEGVVIKSYEFVNRFGRTVWAKLVTSEFKAKHTKALGPREVLEKAKVEDKIAAEFVTRALVDKTFAKIENDGGWTSRAIPRLLNMVYYDVVREEAWEMVKRSKNPTIDFGQLQRAVFEHVKVHRPELFA